MRFRGSPALAALPLLAGSSLLVWGHYVDAMDLVMVSFMLVSVGVGLLWFGVRFVRALAIPWAILAFAFPAPAVVTNQAFYVLRLWTAAHTTALLQFVGFPVLREGNVIHGTNVIAQVVDTCSGLRSMEILTLAALFYVGFFPVQRLRQVLFVVLAPAIAYLFNLFRVGVISVAPTSEFSAAHTAQGLAVFFGAISCLVLTDRVLGHFLRYRPQRDRAALRPKTEPGSQLQASPEAATDASGGARSMGRLGDAALMALAVAMLGASIWTPRWSAPKEIRLAPIALPAELDGWMKGEKIALDHGFLWIVRFVRFDYRIYRRDGEEVSVFIGENDRSQRGRSIRSRKNALPRRGFEVEERDFVVLEPIEARIERVVARSESAHVLTYHWYEGTEGLVFEILRALFATDQSPFRRSQPARVIRVATVLASSPIARAEDEAKLRAFTSSLAAALRE